MSTDPMPLPSFSERAEAVLAGTFGGMHHVYSLKKFEGINAHWTMIHSGDFSTFDFDHMTRFVLLCHKHCVRGSITNGGPRALKLMVSERKGREGSWATRHPTIEQAISLIAPTPGESG